MLLKIKSSYLVFGVSALSAASALAGLQTDYANWVTDRMDPAGFSNIGGHLGRSNVLEVDISGSDFTAPLNTYNNTQGKAYTPTTPVGTLAVAYGSVYVPSDWNSIADGRYTVLSAFGTASSECQTLGNDSCTRYLNFAVTNTTGSAAAAMPGTPQVQFRTSSGITRGDAGDDYMPGWQLHDVVNVGDWNDVCIVLSDDKLRHYANGSLIRDVDISATPATTKPDQISRTQVNTQNRGSDYQAHWSNIGLGALGQVGTVNGSGQSAITGSSFSGPISIEVLDTDGDPLPCVEVTLSAPAGGASGVLSEATVVTDISGIATIAVSANNEVGGYSIIATLPNGEESMIPLTNIAAPLAEETKAIPTLSTWSLILSTLLICGLGAVSLRRRL